MNGFLTPLTVGLLPRWDPARTNGMNLPEVKSNPGSVTAQLGGHTLRVGVYLGRGGFLRHRKWRERTGQRL